MQGVRRGPDKPLILMYNEMGFYTLFFLLSASFFLKSCSCLFLSASRAVDCLLLDLFAVSRSPPTSPFADFPLDALGLDLSS